MKITEKPNTYRTTYKKLLDGRHDRLINVHCRDHVTRQKSKQRHRSLKLADFHNQSPLLTMVHGYIYMYMYVVLQDYAIMDQNWVSTFDVTMVTKAFQEKKSSMSQNSNYF